MAATGSGHASAFASRSGLPTFGNFGSTLLERSNPGLRRSTPDSEALASSDEEVEQARFRSAQRRSVSNRRSSLLPDQNEASHRQFPSVGPVTHSPGVGSQQIAPATSQDTWNSISPSVSAWNTASAYPFGSSIWGANSRDPPPRLQEVRQDNSTDSSLPFNIPPQPNLSVQRSMSFSVGQSDYDSPSSTTNPTMATTTNSATTTNTDLPSRARPSLARRSSRPSNLGHEYGGLARVSEAEDAETSHVPAPHKANNIRTPSRTVSNPSSSHNTTLFRAIRALDPTLEVPETAIEDAEDSPLNAQATREMVYRRLSDFQPTLPTRQPHNPPFSSAGFLNARNTPSWSSNLGFGHLDQVPESRRHSFLENSARRGSMGSNENDEETYSGSYGAGSQTFSQENEAPYFARNEAARQVTQQEVHRQLTHEQHQSIFTTPGPYPVPSSVSSIYGANPVPLYIVTFKCLRADIFYIPDGSSLVVKEGDLVIVEADRGEDIGTVQHARITYESAKKYKPNYAEQHFRWLMMFSTQTNSGAQNLFNPNAVVPGRGSGPYGNTVRDSDLQPKIIKRHATTHDFQELHGKEGAEAKAKRVCVGRVKDHELNMEILDAEFQFDGRKLTFYFFSTEYINFNSLVTDLFRTYKTRIWMSAINPASFQSPVSSLGIQPLYSNTVPVAASLPSDVREERRYDPTQYNSQAAVVSRSPPPMYVGYGQTNQVSNYAGYTPNHPRTDPFAGYNAVPSYGMTRPQNNYAGRSHSTARYQSPRLNGNDVADQFSNMNIRR